MKQHLRISLCALAIFLVWTLCLCFVDVQPIGPQGSEVGFASLNRFVHKLLGVHLRLYHVTDWLSLIPLACMMGFAILGMMQWLQRKHIKYVDFSLLALGGFYVVVLAVFLLFEVLAVNYRPILIQGCLEPSYPSSTTLLSMCILPTTCVQLSHRCKQRWLILALRALLAFMVLGRFLSGVHWFSDIIGGALLSTAFVELYRASLSFSNT